MKDIKEVIIQDIGVSYWKLSITKEQAVVLAKDKKNVSWPPSSPWYLLHELDCLC